MALDPKQLPDNRVRCPTVLQMEAVECGAAALGIILAYHGRRVPLEELRIACGVSRDGSKAKNVLKAARGYGLEADGYRKELEELPELKPPVILFWNFSHYLVLEGFHKGRAFVNDPATGPREVSLQELDRSYTGVVLMFERTAAFREGGRKTALLAQLLPRLAGSRTALLYAVLCGLLLVVPGLLVPAFSQVFVDDVLLAGRTDWARALLLGMALTALLRGALTYLQQRTLLRLQTKLALASASRFFWHVLQLPIDFFHQRFPGDLATRVQINDRVADLLSGQLAITAISLCTMVFYAAVMLAYDPALTAVGVCFAALDVMALRWVSRRRVDENQKLLRARGQAISIAMGGIQMMETLKSTGTESEFFVQWSGHYTKSLNAEQALGALTSWLNAVPPLLAGLGNVALIALGGLRVMDGHLSVGQLVAFQGLMLAFMDPVTRLVNLGSLLQEMQGEVARLDDVLAYEPDPRVSHALQQDEAAGHEAKLEGRVELRDVTFGYSRLEKPLISGLNLRIEPGQRVALVGSSGSGKSTIAKLVSGLYEPWQGEILFDGRPRAQIPREVLNDSIGLVDQDISMFAGSIRENVVLWDETLGDLDVVGACRDAAIHDEVVQRTDGYHSPVAESGLNFSGGQRQRLEIARALVGNPSVLVLDEATSALDASTEKDIDDHLRRRGCSCLIVAHRLSTIRDADEIVVLDQGAVVERGTHEQLNARGGLYARLIEN